MGCFLLSWGLRIDRPLFYLCYLLFYCMVTPTMSGFEIVGAFAAAGQCIEQGSKLLSKVCQGFVRQDP